VTFTRGTSPAEISRRDLSRRLVVDANLDGLPLGTAGTLALQAADRVTMAPGYSLSQGGDTEMMIESFGYLGESLILGVIFVYLILAAQFESFIDPLSIMISLPLSIVGMAGMLAITGDTVNIMSLIGLIMLMGLVTKNAILLIDYTKILRAGGMDRRQALITAGRTRLRPIMMTTSAMIAGMLPLFFGIGEGAEFRAPMARAVVGGLITSTMLTLVVVPVTYSILDDISTWLFARRRRHAPAAVAGMLATAMLFGSAREAGAQEQPRVLTLEAALAIAAEKNRDVQKAAEYRNWVQGKYEEERAAALPQAKFVGAWRQSRDSSQSKLFEGSLPGGVSSDGISEIFGGRQQTLTGELQLTQVVFTFGQIGSAIKAAALGIEFSEVQLERFRQAVARDVSAAYWNVLAAREMVQIARADLEQKQRHLDEATRRHTLGTVTDYDVLAARVGVENARPAVIRAEHGVTQAREQLRFLLAEPNPVDVVGSLEGAAEPGAATTPGYDELLARAYASRPEIKELTTQQGIYDQLIKIAASSAKPRVDFSANWGPRYLGLQSFSSSGLAWNMGVFATIPIFDGFRTKGRVAQVRSEQAQLRLDELKVRENIALEVRRAVDAAAEAAAIVASLTSTVTQAEELRGLAEKGFELGVKTRLDVQDADLNLRSARANLAAARRDYQIALVNIAWVSGTIGRK
jgi:HAE1 family hydrophobic/amphiphilic exporter-1